MAVLCVRPVPASDGRDACSPVLSGLILALATPADAVTGSDPEGIAIVGGRGAAGA